MTRNDYEPLIVKIRNRFLSWTSKALSYAGRLQLIKSVIASIANFWCSAFCLPQAFLDEIESMCSAFLWSGSPNNTSCAKISWEEVCRPYEEGGLGVRRMSDVGTVFVLKLIWKIFSHPASLWVVWVQRYLLKQETLWDMKDTGAGSWIWRKLLKYMTLAQQFIRMDIRDRRSVRFWSDVWHPQSQMIDIAGETGIQKLGVRREAMMCDVFVQGIWQFRRCRDPRIRSLILAIDAFHVSLADNSSDRMLWKAGEDVYNDRFTSTATWELLRGHMEKVNWRNVVWFSQGVPRFAFITWVAVRDRDILSTGHCTTRWGHPRVFLYCVEPDETRDHLFFACPYTFTLWLCIAGNLFGRDPDPDWDTTMVHLRTGKYDRLTFILLRLALQVTIYYIWRERNERRHNNIAKPVDHLARLIDKMIRSRITSLGYTLKPKLHGLMCRWFASRR